jgi:hypothetical protein
LANNAISRKRIAIFTQALKDCQKKLLRIIHHQKRAGSHKESQAQAQKDGNRLFYLRKANACLA